jgi:hypothetical protein
MVLSGQNQVFLGRGTAMHRALQGRFLESLKKLPEFCFSA